MNDFFSVPDEQLIKTEINRIQIITIKFFNRLNLFYENHLFCIYYPAACIKRVKINSAG